MINLRYNDIKFNVIDLILSIGVYLIFEFFNYFNKLK